MLYDDDSYNWIEQAKQAKEEQGETKEGTLDGLTCEGCLNDILDCTCTSTRNTSISDMFSNLW